MLTPGKNGQFPWEETNLVPASSQKFEACSRWIGVKHPERVDDLANVIDRTVSIAIGGETWLS